MSEGNIHDVIGVCRSASEAMVAEGIQWRLDPRYILRLCDALTAALAVQTQQGVAEEAPCAHTAGWSYDLAAAPNGLMEFAFTNSLGMINVRICDRMGHHTDAGLQYFYREDDRPDVDLNSNGWRAFAWRRIEVPPIEPSPPASGRSALVDVPAVESEPVAVPEGWALVPIQPSEEMVAAGSGWPTLPGQTWTDMLDTAPLCPIPPREPVALIEREVLAELAKHKTATGTVCSPFFKSRLGDKVPLFAHPPRSLPNEGWMPIETAPKDGTQIIGRTTQEQVFACNWFWDDENETEGDWLEHGTDVVRPREWLTYPALSTRKGSAGDGAATGTSGNVDG